MTGNRYRDGRRGVKVSPDRSPLDNLCDLYDVTMDAAIAKFQPIPDAHREAIRAVEAEVTRRLVAPNASDLAAAAVSAPQPVDPDAWPFEEAAS